MYNEIVKQQFLDYLSIDHKDSYVKEYRNIFKKIEKYEGENERDISCFDIIQLLDMYDSFDVKYLTKIKYNDYLLRYIEFINHENEAFNQAKSFLQKKKNEQNNINVTTPRNISYSELMQFIETLENPSDKFLIYGLFCGISGTNYVELSHSSMEDSDPSTGLIWLAGYDNNNNIEIKHRKFIADRDLFKMALESSESENYIVKRNNGTKHIKSYIPDDRRILKKTRKDIDQDDTNAYRATIINRCKAIVKDTDFTYLNPGFLYWSGAAYQVKRMAVDLGKTNIAAKQAIKLPEFEKIREQYCFRIEDRSLVLKLGRYL